MTAHVLGSTTGRVTDELDLTVLLLTHDALRRDLVRLQEAARRPGSAGRVEYFASTSGHLHHHHAMEDQYVWPVLRERVDEQGRAVLDDMEAEHATIDPLLERISGQVEQGGEQLVEDLDALAGSLTAHLAHEERDAIPLVLAHFTVEDQKKLERGARKAAGIRGAARFFPWLLDEADPALAARLMSLLTPPLRWLTKGPWRRRHERLVAALV